MPRVLVTGMSGTGKSTVLTELARRGVRTVDTDDGDWGVDVPDPDGPGLMRLWREDAMDRLLDGTASDRLVVSGTVSNQGRFYDRFDAVVLLSAPLDVLLERLRTRQGNDFGKDPVELERILRDVDDVQPRLRATCTHELDATLGIDIVADLIEELLDGLEAPVSRS
jgi:dephospho-CoA kinase